MDRDIDGSRLASSGHSRGGDTHHEIHRFIASSGVCIFLLRCLAPHSDLRGLVFDGFHGNASAVGAALLAPAPSLPHNLTGSRAPAVRECAVRALDPWRGGGSHSPQSEPRRPVQLR